MMQTLSVSNTSTLSIPARKIYQLAATSLLEIEQIRKRKTNETLEELSKQVIRFGPLNMFSRPRFNSEAEALSSPEIFYANMAAYSDHDTCMQLQKAAQYLMENIDENALMTITLNDFRALT